MIRKMLIDGFEIVDDTPRKQMFLFRSGELFAQAVPVPVTPRTPNEKRWIVRTFQMCFYPKEYFKSPIPTWGLGADPRTFKILDSRGLAELELLKIPLIVDNNAETVPASGGTATDETTTEEAAA